MRAWTSLIPFAIPLGALVAVAACSDDATPADEEPVARRDSGVKDAKSDAFDPDASADGATSDAAPVDAGPPEAGTSRTVKICGVDVAYPSTKITAGGDISCAIRKDNKIHCWGAPTPALGGSTVQLGALENIIDVGSGNAHSCALNTSGEVFCFGSNDNQQLAGSNAATPVPGLTDVVDIGVGALHTCASTTSGEVRCWGLDQNDRLGGGSPTSSVANVDCTAEIVAGESHTCARRTDGTVRCWGNVPPVPESPPVKMAEVTNTAQLAAGCRYTCARSTDGKVKCWGNEANQVIRALTATPAADTADSLGGARDTGLTDVSWIAAGCNHMCAVKKSGAVHCWGNDDEGQLGGSSLTTPVNGRPDVTRVGAGRSHTCVLSATNDVFCWGQVTSGQVSGSSIVTPVRLP